ncbi:MAG: hypothetical protein U1E73_04255 [Planctomycetota bacterium]
MTIEGEARSRHVAAFVEEAVAGGMPVDLPQRIAARLAAVPGRRRWRQYWMAAAFVAGLGAVVATSYLRRGSEPTGGAVPADAPAQDPQKAPQGDGEALELRIRPVRGDAGADAVEWSLGPQRFTTLKDLAAALRTAAAGTAAAGSDEHGEQLPIVIRPDRGVEWRQVTAATDAAMAAGVLAIRYEGVGDSGLVPTGVEAPKEGGVELAEARFQEPADEPPPADLPIFRVAADGTITAGGEVLFRPGPERDPDVAKLRDHIARLREQLLPRGERAVAPGGRKVLVAPVRVLMDRRVEWRHVQRLLQLVTDPAAGFFLVQLAVAAPKPAGDAPKAQEIK